MKKILIILPILLLALSMDSVAFADSYDGPYCFENPADYREYSDDSEHIRGTCKEIEVSTVISLDPALQNDYLLGTHYPVSFFEYEDGSANGPSKYSENIIFSGKTSMIEKSMGIEDIYHFAIFDKQFLVSKLSNMFLKGNIPLDKNNIPNISITVIKKDEIPKIPKGPDFERPLNLILSPDTKLDLPQKTESSDRYDISTLNYLEYGKHIYAPKDKLIESQYAEIEKHPNMLKDKDLGIKAIAYGHWGRSQDTFINVTSPLKSVTNYWMYTKKNGKLVLAWQKSEYGLDNGKTKIVTNADKNVSAALLFANSADDSAISTTSAKESTPANPQQEKKVGFFARIFQIILSWFK